MIRQLNILSDSETNQLIAYNQTAAEYPTEKTIHQFLEEQAERTPDQTAVVYEDSRLTYRELNEKANQLARTLQSEGVQPDQPVGIMAERSLDMIVGIFGILKVGGAYVPIDPAIPRNGFDTYWRIRIRSCYWCRINRKREYLLREKCWI